MTWTTPATPKSELRNALADFVREALEGGDPDITVVPSWPKTLTHSMAVVMPQTPYTDESAGTFTKTAVSLRIVLIAPPFDFDDPQDWLDYHTDLLRGALQARTAKIGDFKCPHVTSTEIGRFGDAASLLGAELFLSPVTTKTES